MGAALPELRPATAADIPAMLDVFFEADEHLRASDGRAARPRRPEAIRPFFEHQLRTDPASAFVATDHGRPIAFGMATVRDGAGFLSELFVVPRWQSRGIGSALLSACFDGAGATRLATCVDVVQPVSSGLYASRGLVPRTPLYVLSGPLRAEHMPGLPVGVVARPLPPASVAAIDAEIVGYRRPADHSAWARAGRRGWVFLSAGVILRGYGYVREDGRIGPILARQPADLLSFVGHLARSVTSGHHRCLVPGPAGTLFRRLLEEGLRIDDAPSVYCADHDGPDFERYLPASTSLL